MVHTLVPFFLTSLACLIQSTKVGASRHIGANGHKQCTEMLCRDEQYTSFSSYVMCISVHREQEICNLRPSEPGSIGGRKSVGKT